MSESTARREQSKSDYPVMVSKDGKYQRQPSTASAYYQLKYDGWKPQSDAEGKKAPEAKSETGKPATQHQSK